MSLCELPGLRRLWIERGRGSDADHRRLADAMAEAQPLCAIGYLDD